MENQTIKDIDKLKTLESSSFDGIVHLDKDSYISMHDFVGLDDHCNSQIHVSNQHISVNNNNDVVIDDPLAHELVDESNISFRKSIR